MHTRLHYLGLGLLLVTADGRALAKEAHFEQVRVLLIANSARCTSCHVEADGKSLNDYGKRLAAGPKDEPLADRIAAVEADPPADATEAERKRIVDGHDVDRDGVANWVEILAASNPADAADKTEEKIAKRIEKVVSCNLCHVSTHGPGEGLAANPHNAFGRLMASTYAVPRRGRKPADAEATRAAAERTPILTRLGMVRTKKPTGSKATWWEKIQLLYPPTDSNDEPKPKELAEFRKAVARQKRPATRDANRGLRCKSHKPDGFLEDARDLVH